MPAKAAAVCKFERLFIRALARQLQKQQISEEMEASKCAGAFQAASALKEIAQHKCAKRRRTTGTKQTRPIATKGRLDGSGVETMVRVPIIVLLPGRWNAV